MRDQLATIIKGEVGNQILCFNPLVFSSIILRRWVDFEDFSTFRTPDPGPGGFYTVAVQFVIEMT